MCSLSWVLRNTMILQQTLWTKYFIFATTSQCHEEDVDTENQENKEACRTESEVLDLQSSCCRTHSLWWTEVSVSVVKCCVSGGVCCYSCRAFFRRSRGRIYHCKKGTEACLITADNRKFCKLCRYNKCLQVGLLGLLHQPLKYLKGWHETRAGWY